MTPNTAERRELLSSSSDDLLYGVVAIAAAIPTIEPLALLLLEEGLLKGEKVGDNWTSTKSNVEAARAAAFANSNRLPGAPRGYQNRASFA